MQISYKINAAFVALILSFLLNKLVNGIDVEIPLRCRTEGRITIRRPQGNQTFQRNLAFSESIDSVEKVAVTNINYVSYKQAKYFSRQNTPTITVGSGGICKSLKQTEAFVPEINWFIEYMLPSMNLTNLNRPTSHIVGPTGLVSLFFIMSDAKFKFAKDREEFHRNVRCTVYLAHFHLNYQKTTIKFEIFVPIETPKFWFNDSKASFFTVKATAYPTPLKNQNSNEKLDESTYKSKFIIDYYHIESMQDKIEALKEDFNLPLASGCSEFVKKFQPSMSSQTFSMIYRQESIVEPIFIAYDHVRGYMRKEHIGRSVSIWDLNEDLVYHVDPNAKSTNHTQNLFTLKACSISKITDEKLGPAYRPYKTNGESLDALTLIGGASPLAYMGRSQVRNIPCLVYEVILNEPPIVFALSSEQFDRHAAYKRDYIIQFHLIEGQRMSAFVPDEERQALLLKDNIWPAKIDLYRRNLDANTIDKLDSLNIFEFFDSLDGWTKKRGQLFMASECFDDKNDQIRVELDVQFDRIHNNVDGLSEADKSILAHNKFKLESYLLDDILDTFVISRMHLIDYEMKLEPNHVSMYMIIADRKEAKVLAYYGPGELPTPDSYEMNRIVWHGQNEESCVAASSLVKDISLVIFCPSSDTKYSYCVSVYDEAEPVVSAAIDTDPTVPTCQAYRFIPDSAPNAGTTSVTWKKFGLNEHTFNFEAKIPEKQDQKLILKGVIRSAEISREIQLMSLDNYNFALPSDVASSHSTSNNSGQPSSNQTTTTTTTTSETDNNLKNVKYFDTISYKTRDDCEKMCNLDVTCKSYSFCSTTEENNLNLHHKCILSRLDIRTSNIKDQLVHSSMPPTEGRKITIKDSMQGETYDLRFKDHCTIYERNYLSMFSETDEIVRLKHKLANRYQTALTTFECAKQIVDLEQAYSDHHVATFAYCPTSNTCILDESLFAMIGNMKNGTTKETEDLDEESEKKEKNSELLCRIYRKKFQSYFEVSANVLKLSVTNNQIEFNFNTVEECARACWNRFGQICSSFDYCNPSTCLINGYTKEAGEQLEFETRSDCLHYERDLKLDELRKKHALGRHEILDLKQQDKNAKGGAGIFGRIIMYSIVLCTFIYGLMLGGQINDRMESVKIFRQSISMNSSNRTNRRQSICYAGYADDYDEESGSTSLGEANNIRRITTSILNDGYDDDEFYTSNAIKMDVIKKKDQSNSVDDNVDGAQDL